MPRPRVRTQKKTLPRSARKKRDEGYRKTAAARAELAGDGEIHFTCPECGKAAFITRGAARRFARRVYPGSELSPYRACGGKFHLTSQDARKRAEWKDWAADQDAG